MADKFIIVSELNELVLEVEHASFADGAKFVTSPYSGEEHQQFRFKPNGEIAVASTGKGLNIENGAAQGSRIIQQRPCEAPNQLWRIHKDGSIRCVGTNLCLDILHDNRAPGADVVANPHHGSPSQKWKLVNSFN